MDQMSQDLVALKRSMEPEPKSMRHAGTSYIEKVDMTQEEREANTPRPLPTKRPRSLSIPPAEFLGQTADRINTLFIDHKRPPSSSYQHQSPLMRLPTELRQIIWEEAVGGILFHIIRCPKRLLGIRCPESIGVYPSTIKNSCCAAVAHPSQLQLTPGVYRGSRNTRECFTFTADLQAHVSVLKV